MNLQDLKPSKGSTKNRKRIGRGQASGQGCTSGKGTKGQKSRSGYSFRPWFEGGQMPLQRRTPKRGFVNIHAKPSEAVNVSRLVGFGGEVVTAEVLAERGLINNPKCRLTILGNGEIGEPVTVRAHKFSPSAKQKIEAAGGTAEVIVPPRRYKRLKKKSERPKKA
ncbi:MAG: 50S ribosomal protein L15 [Candidatus Eisenbacteria bacterium]|uniref:Large ribosomal subunit protein uL15 n=1 Tax=Eiseniibacteriota bacterium TaxID=2212470 RepID=A0A7Y2E861_UNCEI|nr:50S ribosomal protein L15 [Candidatus Eisenbacteria bacterium]